MFGRKKEKEKQKQPAPAAGAAVSWEHQLAAGGLMGLLSGGQTQQASFLVTGESVDVHVAPPPQATEKVSAVEKGEGKKLKSTIQGFNRQAISRPAAAQAPTGQTAAAAEEKQPLSGGLLGAPAPGSKGLERMKSREDLLAEKERAAKAERERALRERMQRKEELMRREAERLTQLKREQRDNERRRQAEETARAREAEKARRAAAIAAAIAEVEDGDSAGLPAAQATPAVPAPKTSDATPPARPDAGSAKPAPPPTRFRPELSHNRPADEQPLAPKPLIAVQGQSPMTADRKDTPVPVRKATAEAQASEPTKFQAPSVSPRKFATPSKGVQFAKGYQENGVRDASSKLMQSVVMSSFARMPIASEEVQGLPEEHKRIVELCSRVKQKWTDPDFEPTDSSIWKNPERHKGEKVVWKRIEEICPKPSLFVDGVEPDDILQGTLGDCWFLGPLSVIALYPNLLMNLFNTSEYSRWGVYSVQFWMGSEWVPVVVDDWIPCSPEGKPLYAHSRDPNEFWVMILEKAYAKVHRSYEALESGSEGDAFHDLTGCPPHEIVLMSEESQRDIKNGKMWERLVKYFSLHHLIGCSRADSKNTEVRGILCNHAYGLIDVQTVDGVKMLKIRNPWGEKEWDGDWSDKSPLWTPQIKKRLDIVDADDGVFWMCFEDFVKYFTCIYLCSQIPSDWHHHTATGEWKGPTAGGSADTAAWRGNPQYYIRVPAGGCDLAVLVSQPSIRSKATQSRIGAYPPIGFYLLKTEGKQRSLVIKREDMLAGTVFRKGRETSEDFTLQEGEYILIPCTLHRGVQSKYNVVVYSEKQIVFEQITEVPVVLSAKSEWTAESCGGCANNGSWKNNPQFFLTVPQTTRLTILQAFDDRKGEFPHHGFYILRSTNGTARNSLINSKHITTKSDFVNSQEVALTVTLKPGNYLLVPCTFRPGIRDQFTLVVYAQQDAGVDFGPIAKVDFKKHLLEGEWKGKEAAGSGPTWSNNPQYTICFADPVEKATLTLSTDNQKLFVVLSVMAVDQRATGLARRMPGFHKNSFIVRSQASRATVSVSFPVEQGKVYYVIPSTTNVGEEGRFSLEAQSKAQPILTLCDASTAARGIRSSQQYEDDSSRGLEVHGRWKGESAGGCVNYPTWRNNPQYLLHVKQTRVLTITLAQIDTTALLPIGLYLGQSSEDSFMLCHLDQENLIESTPFTDRASVSMTITVKASPLPYVLIPATFDPEMENEFTVSVTSDDDLTAIALSPAEHYHLSMEGDWRDGRGGGCKNHPSWRNNPQYHFKAPVKIYVLLSQPETEEDMPHIGYYLLKNEDGGAVMTIDPSNLLHKSDFVDDVEVGELVTLKEPGIYTILPCTFNPFIETKFALNLYANEHIESTTASCNYTKLFAPGQWTARNAGGCSGHPTFHTNPQFRLTSPMPGTAIGGWKMQSTGGAVKHGVEVVVVVSQPLPAANTIGFYLVTRRDKRFLSKEVTFVKGTEASAKYRLHKGVEYGIIVCTHEPGALGRFSLDVYVTHPSFTLTPV